MLGVAGRGKGYPIGLTFLGVTVRANVMAVADPDVHRTFASYTTTT